MNDRIAVTQEMWDRAQAALLAALSVVERLVPPQSTQGNMISLRDQMRDAIHAPNSNEQMCPHPSHVRPRDCQQWTELVLSEMRAHETPAPLACGVDVGFNFKCRRPRGHAGPHTWDPKRLYGEDPVSEKPSP